jgi:4,5-DOPA dioxygenase extradiol
VVFVSHGAPDVLLHAPRTVACWRDLAADLPAPSAILVISAHWQARVPTASLAGAPSTIHDFSGFSAALDRLSYPAPGAPDLAERVAQRLSDAGITADLHPNRGLDHGAWIPLLAMYPQAQWPVTQLALPRELDMATLFALGQALAPLRANGVLILGSGAVTHNFDWLNWSAGGESEPDPRAQSFADWVGDRLLAGDTAALTQYRGAPNGVLAHPTAEHFAPLIVAAGAADLAPARRIQPPFAYGGLAMDAYVWGGTEKRSTIHAAD